MADANSPAQLHTEPAELGADERLAEVEQARRLAARYRLEFIDMDAFRIDQDLFRSIPADLMLRYGFDLSYEDIAAALGSSENAARQAASSGVRRLRERSTTR